MHVIPGGFVQRGEPVVTVHDEKVAGSSQSSVNTVRKPPVVCVEADARTTFESSTPLPRSLDRTM